MGDYYNPKLKGFRLPCDLEYHLRIIPAKDKTPWSAVLEGHGTVLRFSSLLELARYLEVAAQRTKVIEPNKTGEKELL
jgi:hypothetical protein